MDLERKSYLKRLRKAPAGKRIRELALTGSLQERFDICDLALNIFDTKDVWSSYKNDLLDSSLDNRVLRVGLNAKPWSEVRPDLLAKIFAAMDPEYWTSNSNDVGGEAEARYVLEVSDLLPKVVDGFLEKRFSFSDPVDAYADVKTKQEFLMMANRTFFDLVQRTSDRNLKQSLLIKLEALRASLPPKELADQRNRLLVSDLDYVIACYRDDPPFVLPRRTALRMRKQK